MNKSKTEYHIYTTEQIKKGTDRLDWLVFVQDAKTFEKKLFAYYDSEQQANEEIERIGKDGTKFSFMKRDLKLQNSRLDFTNL